MSSLVAFVGNNACLADPVERENSIRSKVPELLQADEKIVFAFKDRGGKGRDSSSLTSKRILIKDKRGITGKRTDYISIPYSSIRAYSVETAGSMDSDTELRIFASGYGKIALDFVTASVDIFAIYRFLNSVVLTGDAIGSDVPDGAIPTTADAYASKSKTGLFDLIGSNASQVDASSVESKLKDPSVNILLANESVELAFKCGRDSFILTSHRILRVDVQGMSGKRVEYYTLLWKSVRAFSVETAGSFLDRDSELLLYTNVPDSPSSAPGMPRKKRCRFSIDFRKGGADLFAVQRYIADKLLGQDTMAPSQHAISMAGVTDTGSNSVFAWLGDDSRMIDAQEMDRRFHSSPSILQSSERVEMAFKGRRDLMLFTSKRLIFVDTKGWSGQKVEYTSVPWKTVQLFGVRSAGSVDKDSEVMFWTDFDDCFFPPKDSEDAPPPPPIPRKSFIECDFQKDKVDILAVHRYLSERCLRVEGGHVGRDGIFVPNHLSPDVAVPPDVTSPAPPGSLAKFMDWLGNDARAVDVNELDATMHETGAPILQMDERVVMAYRSGRDTFIVTNKRVFLIDTQGFSGKRVAYISIPFTSIRAFAVESAGSWDRDSEVKIWTKTFWKAEGGIGNKLEQDLRKGRADIISLQSYLAAQVIGSTDGASSLQPGATAVQAGSFDTFLSYLNNNAVSMEPSAVEGQLRTSPPILQTDESIDALYKMGRDMCVYTTKRVLLIDRQGMSGKRIEYRSFPLRYVTAFKVSTAGSFVSSAEATIFADGSKSFSQDLSKCSSDIWQVATILTNKVLK